MKKNFFYKAYCAAFICICAAPAVLMPVFKSDSTKEKRELAPAPTFKTSDGKLNFEFFDQFGEWFSDHFAFRRELVSADGRLKTSVFGTSPNSDVIAGKDGWLYYGEASDDFLNLNTLSEREIGNICHNIRMLSDYCTANDARFLFFSAPNKNSVYPEFMPSNYVPADCPDNYTLIEQQLSGESFYLDMKSAILQARANIPLYHKTDTHWNNMGAYVGHTAIMAQLGLTSCPAGSQWSTAKDRLGDLAAMIYPAEKAKDVQVYSDYEFTYTYQGRFRALDDVIINTVSENGEGELLMFRDSYGEAILPYMAEQFSSAEFSRVVPYRMDGVTSGKTVILEIVERNLGNLQKYAPVMSAPVAETPDTPEKILGGLEFMTEESGKYKHIFGELPEDCFSGADHTIYVTMDGVTYTAFNCFEDKLLGREGERSGNGFSLYVPLDVSTDGVTVTVVNSDGSSAAIN